MRLFYMKKYICISIVTFMYSMLFSQKRTQKDTALDKHSIYLQDMEEHTKANRNPIIKKIYDTLGADYLEQHFYHNGNLYYQVPFKNGKKKWVI